MSAGAVGGRWLEPPSSIRAQRVGRAFACNNAYVWTNIKSCRRDMT